MSDSLRPHGLHTAVRLHFHHLPELAQTHIHWVGDAFWLELRQSYIHLFFFLSTLRVKKAENPVGRNKLLKIHLRWNYYMSHISLNPKTDVRALYSRLGKRHTPEEEIQGETRGWESQDWVPQTQTFFWWFTSLKNWNETAITAQ